MKILYVLNADWYFDLHWKERALNALTQGYEVHIAVPSCDRILCDALIRDGLIVHEFSMTRSGLSLFQEFQSILALNSLINKITPDLIHSVTIKPNLYCLILCWMKKLPLVSTYAGLGTLKTARNVKYKFLRGGVFNLIKIFSRKTKMKALFENQEDLDFFCNNRYLQSNKLLRVFGAGVNLNDYSYSSRASKSSRFTVLFAARLLRDKGLMTLVEAVKILKKQSLPIELKVAGIFDLESPLAIQEEEILELESRGDIVWLGTRSDINSLISDSDVVALPTVYGEGVPRILIEACAVGRPIITTPLGGCTDICKDGENGILVGPHSVDEIVDALQKLINNVHLVNEYGVNGRKLVEHCFSNESIFKQNLIVYRSLLS